MEQVAKKFTVIDFLGYIAPGGAFLLILQFFTRWATIPYYAFFGQSNQATLTAYFIFMSYLCGNFLHEIGAMAESLLMRENMHAGHWENPEVRSAYQRKLSPSGSLDPGFPSTPKEQVQAGKTIFHYVQRTRRPQRLMLFHAFFIMGRTLFVTALFAILMCAADSFLCPGNICRNCWIALTCVLCAVLSYFRWRGFERRSIAEAYLHFITEDQGQKDPEANE